MPLRAIHKIEYIPAHIVDTPIGDLLAFHNLGIPFREYLQAQLLIGMCMDNRKQLRIPKRFAFIIRTGGANTRYLEFNISYAIAIGQIKHIALIGHTQCGMVNLAARRDAFVEGLVTYGGWSTGRALEHFQNFAPLFEIDNEIVFTKTEAQRLSEKYPAVTTLSLLHRVEDDLLYLIED